MYGCGVSLAPERLEVFPIRTQQFIYPSSQPGGCEHSRSEGNGPSNCFRREGGYGDFLKSGFHEISQIYVELIPKCNCVGHAFSKLTIPVLEAERRNISFDETDLSVGRISFLFGIQQPRSVCQTIIYFALKVTSSVSFIWKSVCNVLRQFFCSLLNHGVSVEIIDE
jgi:hypothetical protein